MKKDRKSLKGVRQSGRNIRVSEIYEGGTETEMEKVCREREKMGKIKKVQETEATELDDPSVSRSKQRLVYNLCS